PPTGEPTPDPTPTPHAGVYDEFDISGPFPVVRAFHRWEQVRPGSAPIIEDGTERLSDGEFWIESHSVHTGASLIQTQVIGARIDLGGPARRIEVTPVFRTETGTHGPFHIYHHSVTIPPGYSTTGLHLTVGL